MSRTLCLRVSPSWRKIKAFRYLHNFVSFSAASIDMVCYRGETNVLVGIECAVTFMRGTLAHRDKRLSQHRLKTREERPLNPDGLLTPSAAAFHESSATGASDPIWKHAVQLKLDRLCLHVLDRSHEMTDLRETQIVLSGNFPKYRERVSWEVTLIRFEKILNYSRPHLVS